MPRYDGKGPRGDGPMTGKGRGYCMMRIPDTPDESATGYAGLSGRPVVVPCMSPEHRVSRVYGPVPSRRLNRSLGVDLVPFKTCTYDCLYCQLGRTTVKTVDRQAYVPAGTVLAELECRLLSGLPDPDYISISGSGEPTLNSEIGQVVEGIKRMTNVPVAILTNGSLLSLPEVQDALLLADVVLPSLDAGDESLFQYVNRPHPLICFEDMLDGLISFAKRFRGEVWLEVLLLAGVTGIPSEVKKIAALAERIGPARVQLNTVCRPPAEPFALGVSSSEMAALRPLFAGPSEIISHEGAGFAEAEREMKISNKEILALLQRRPCTVTDVADGLGLHVSETLKRLDELLREDTVATSVVGKQVFYAAAPQEAASTKGEK